MNRMEAPLFSGTGEAKGSTELPASCFEARGSSFVLHEVLVAFRNNQRRGTSATKTRAHVSGGGHKPWRQKGTGNARAGSIRSPLWRKGGIIFGPHPRSYRVDVDKEKKRLALQAALAEKAKTSAVGILESFPEADGKTGPAEKFLSKTAAAGRVLLVVDKKNNMLVRAVRNVARLRLMDVRELNAWVLMSAHRLLLTQAALQALTLRFSPG